MLEEIGKIIRKQRKALNMTIEQLAEKSGSSPSLISIIERGKLDNIKIQKLNDIARALNLQLSDFFLNKNLQDPDTLNLINYLSTLPEDKRSELAKLIMRIKNL
ncbi:helix-turn-helix domain-containing protein [Companilactobacillus insicii]|uniref:helix-turn-helix domain-containing protein n=1 Tax=Companilactobacillus insicii TaxID=1732567 RepID=UPI000F795A12|nr:helix-turn-helix transcriptional regulator [Companilactobacillus insicii]